MANNSNGQQPAWGGGEAVPKQATAANHFFLMTHKQDHIRIPPWLLDHPKVLKVFAVGQGGELTDCHTKRIANLLV